VVPPHGLVPGVTGPSVRAVTGSSVLSVNDARIAATGAAQGPAVGRRCVRQRNGAKA
jgi:hypothetical protein